MRLKNIKPMYKLWIDFWKVRIMMSPGTWCTWQAWWWGKVQSKTEDEFHQKRESPQLGSIMSGLADRCWSNDTKTFCEDWFEQNIWVWLNLFPQKSFPFETESKAFLTNWCSAWRPQAQRISPDLMELSAESKIEILISFLFKSNFILNTLKKHSFYFTLTNSLVLLHKQSHRIFHILNSFHCVNLTYQKCIISFSFLNSKLAFKMIWKNDFFSQICVTLFSRIDMNYLLIILLPNYELKHKASFTNRVSNYGTFLTFIVRISV